MGETSRLFLNIYNAIKNQNSLTTEDLRNLLSALQDGERPISAVHKEGEEEKLHLLMVDPHILAGAKMY